MKIALDLLDSFGALICFILFIPIRIEKSVRSTVKSSPHIIFLIRNGLLSQILLSRLSTYSLRRYSNSALLLDQVVRKIELLISHDKSTPLNSRLLLCSLYCELQNLYFLSGQTDEAVNMVIRAHMNLGIDRLPTNLSLDLKTAHVIKAGLAASKLLGDQGLASLMNRNDKQEKVEWSKIDKKAEVKTNVIRFQPKNKRPT